MLVFKVFILVAIFVQILPLCFKPMFCIVFIRGVIYPVGLTLECFMAASVFLLVEFSFCIKVARCTHKASSCYSCACSLIRRVDCNSTEVSDVIPKNSTFRTDRL